MSKIAIIICLSLAVSCFAMPEEPCTEDVGSQCAGVRSTARDGATGKFYCCPNGGDPTESSHTTSIEGKQLHYYECTCMTPEEDAIPHYVVYIHVFVKKCRGQKKEKEKEKGMEITMSKITIIICLSLAVSCFAMPEEPCTEDVGNQCAGVRSTARDGVRSTARDGATGKFYCCPNGGDPTESSHTTSIEGKQLHYYECTCMTPEERCDKYSFFC
ncbi:hypothetical protein EGW08_012604 [Elysia chlorotica]|uniref:Uncharacterized protein n=1 Tax=Elysia chlorotica TaxID=188477 RepID=A0A3S1C0K8_ELYCH|nr:hypothetical protein EGW08_012604 [Elysia chlorotica]